jgi:hypothetical protein
MKFAHAAITFIFSFIVLPLTGLTAGLKNPAIALENKFYDFGSVPSDFKIYHLYKIKNTGQNDLYITKLQANCDCTTASIKDSIIHPGDSSQIKIVFLTRDYYGTTNRKVSVFTNVPEKPLVDLDYSANIDVFHKLHTSEPKYLSFIPGRDIKDLLLINNSGQAVDYTIEKEPDSVFSVDEMSGQIPAKANEKIQVAINKNLPKGTYFSNFTVVYNTSPALRLTIPVKVTRF